MKRRCHFRSKAAALLKSAAETRAWAELNTRRLARVYPRGLRVDSSNYDPTPLWCAGVNAS